MTQRGSAFDTRLTCSVVSAQSIQQCLRLLGFDEEPAMFRFDEAVEDGLVEPGEERVKEPVDIQEADRFLMIMKLGPSENLEQLVGGSEAAWQGGKTVGQVGHQGLTLVHSADDMELCQFRVR